MRATALAVFWSVGLITGWLGVELLDRARAERFFAEVDQRCVPRPGEMTVLQNQGGVMRCRRERLLPAEVFQFPWLR